jgi:multidrug efflux pump subunit AcrA (membrane-fusion protein)
MRFLRQSLVGVFLAAMTLGLLGYAFQMIGGAVKDRMSKENKARPAQERVFAVNVIRAKVGVETPILETFGEVKSLRTLELRSAAAGRVIELSDQFVDGGEVLAGQVLVRIDPANAQSSVSGVLADIADAEADARDAERALALAKDEQTAAQEQADLRAKALKRQNDLLGRGVGTAAAVETAELAASSARQAVLARRQIVTQSQARIDQAASALSRAKIALADAERGLADTTLTAPFDGKLSAPSVVAGRLVGANERLAELIDPASLEVSFRVSTAQYARLLSASGIILNADVTVVLDVAGIDLTAKGQISRASVGAGEGQTGRLIFAKLSDSIGFKTGDFVQVRVQEPAVENVVRLPSSALDASGTVLVLGSENRLETIDVELVRRQGDDILVRGRGLEGRDVVEARSPLLGAGIVVKPLGDATDVPEAPSMVELTDERRAKLVAFIEANTRMPAAAKARVLAQLSETQVPARMVERIEGRMGG